MKVISIVGARPNFMKIAPIIKEMKKHKEIKSILVHTGQHYDYKMSGSFFKELGIRSPDINLEVGSGSHSKQTALVMMRLEEVLLEQKPDLVLVVGDVNSTMAAALVASKLCIPVAHVEAGLRSFDRTMPEEINRLVTDSIADILFTTCRDANKNLLNEGVAKKKIFFVGNVMIDTLLQHAKKAKGSKIMQQFGLSKYGFALVTLHRPSNVDSAATLQKILSALKEVQKKIPVVFPIHPRTKNNLLKVISQKELKAMPNLILSEPLSYYDFLCFMMNAKLVITDSGGIQEETTILDIPCLTVRNNTERPVTIYEGTNTLVGTNQERIIKEGYKIIAGKGKIGRRPLLWDGKAAVRIVKILLKLKLKKNV